jgi:hypothetical protein
MAQFLSNRSFARRNCIVAHGVRPITGKENRALVALVSALAKKAPPRKDWLDVNE